MFSFIMKTMLVLCLTVMACSHADREAVEVDMVNVAQSNNNFAVDIYRRLILESGNVFFSPYSIYNALLMTAEGARGETATEMGNVLRFPEALSQSGDEGKQNPWQTAPLHQGMAHLNRQLAGPDPSALQSIQKEITELRRAFKAAQAETQRFESSGQYDKHFEAAQKEKQIAEKLNAALSRINQYELNVANALWGEKSYPFLKKYEKTIADFYDTGGIFSADFKNNYPAERDRINGWVADITKQRIKDLLPELSREEGRMVRLILTNAVYFKGEWAEPFDEKKTQRRDFFVSPEKTVQTSMMQAKNYPAGRYAAFNGDGSYFSTPQRIEQNQKEGLYPANDGFAVLELPYKGDEISMVLCAPLTIDGLQNIEKKLSAENLDLWCAKAAQRKVHVNMPTFKLETKYRLSETLKSLGMQRAFTNPQLPKGADFTGMCSSSDPELRLFISAVLHKAFVEVTEKGTEAAAATAVSMAMATALPVTVPFIPTFNADRPFIFVIRHRPSGTILFLGRMVNPD